MGKNPILGIGYGVSAHDLSGYKVLGVLVVDNGPHVKEPLTALLKPNTKELSQSTAKAHIFLTLRLDPLAKTQYSRVASVTIPKSHDRCRQCPTY